MTAIAHSGHRSKKRAENWLGVTLLLESIEAPNDEVVMSLMLKVGSYGNVRTKTLKAFTAEEGREIIKGLP